MVASMTGFGAATLSDEGVTVSVELQSVNHRHLDVKFRPTTGLPALEANLLGVLRKSLSRGHVDVRITAQATSMEGAVVADLARADAYSSAAREIADHLGVSSTLTMAELMALPGVVAVAPAHALLEARQPLVVQAVTEALEGLTTTRLREGQRLVEDLRTRLAELRRLRGEIAGLAADQTRTRRQQLRERIADAMASVGAAVDEGRLEQELAHLADRADITEELVRLAAHLETFEQTLGQEKPVGRKLGFLGQEVLREVNTIGSKSQLLRITECVVAAKVEVEKIREQVLNLQ